MFETSGTVNNKILKEFSKRLFSVKNKIIFSMAVVAIFAKDYRYFFVFKDCFVNNEKQEFDKFISEKCKMLK